MSGYNPNDMPYGAPITSPEMERAQSRLQQSERSLSRTQQELENAMRFRAKTPVESTAKDQQIALLQKKLSETEAEIKNLEDTIEKQKKTIKTQSDAIANPKQPFATPTPHRFGSSQQYGPHANLALPPPPPPIFDAEITSSQQDQPGPAYPPAPRLQTKQSLVQYNRGPHIQPPPTPFRQFRNVNEFGSPDDLTQSFANLGIASTPMGSNRGSNKGSTRGSNPTPNSSARKNTLGKPSNVPQPPPVPFFNPSNGMALVPASDVVSPTPIARKFGAVLHMTEMYAYSHVNTPSTHKDNAMPPEVKQRLMNAASTTSAFQFMQTPFTRYVLVDKVIIQFLIRSVLKHDCFAGFNPEADQIIENCKNQMYQTTPAQVKYQLLTTIAEQIKKMKLNPHFQNFVSNIARSRGNELWRILKPMMHQKTSRDWEDLYDMMLKAHELAQMMYSGSEEYKFDFPMMGQPFRDHSMEPREPFQNIHTPSELERMHATVRLGMTPWITVRTSTAAGYVNSATVLKAFVLLKTDK